MQVEITMPTSGYTLPEEPSGISMAGLPGSTVLPQFLDTYDEDDGRYTACWTLGQQYDRSGSPIMVEGEPLSYSKRSIVLITRDAIRLKDV